MKKKEILILAVIAGIALAAILVINLIRNNTAADPDVVPSETAQGQWVAVVHRGHVAQWFDSGVDAEYTIEGDYGTMVVEVKDGYWHVEEVECPNHVCESMGWDNGELYIPISCIPNGIYICTSQWVEGYLSD